MRYRHIGNSGMQASSVILGTWATGGFQWGGTDEKESVRAIHAAIDHGVNTIDTAPIYGFGESEKRVGKAIKGQRDKIIIATKCGIVWHLEKGNFFFTADDMGPTQDGSGRKVYRYLHHESIRYEVEQSLKRLGTDYIDLYQIHRIDEITPVHEIMNTLQNLKKEGKIRAIGMSNANMKCLEEYTSEGTLDSDQERYSLFDRGIEKNNIQFCLDNNMAFIAYSPLFHGLLTGKISNKIRFKESDFRSTRLRFTPDYVEKVNNMLMMLKPIQESCSATISQLVLSYLLHQPGCTHVIVGARKADHAIENAKAGDIVISSTQLREMDRIFSDHMPQLES